jgi:hypothetical protein
MSQELSVTLWSVLLNTVPTVLMSLIMIPPKDTEENLNNYLKTQDPVKIKMG